MAKTANVLHVLQLFTEQRRFLRATDVAALLEVSSATAYRYIAELEQAGLIESASGGRYVLGSTIVELDRQIRIHDPLIASAGELMKSLSDRTGGTVILARLHGLKVVCVDQVRGRHGPRQISYERGRAMPLYRGATSTVILANLDQAALARLIALDVDSLRETGLPTEASELAAHLALATASGVAHSDSAVDADVLGWAAAVRQGTRLLGSLSVVVSRSAPEIAPQRIADLLRRAALRLEGRLDAANERWRDA
jgi:DNA-binding IclR family transcriptional regulator